MTKEQVMIVSLLLDKYTTEEEVFKGVYYKSISEVGIATIKRELAAMVDKE